MKKTILAALVLYGLMFLNGCAPLMIASSALTAKSAYEGYETVTSIKNVNEKSPALGDYQNVFISFDVQPRNGKREELNRLLESIYVRNIKEIAAGNGWKVNCKAHDLRMLASGKDALIIQVREQKPSFWNRLVSGDKVHTSIDYIDRKSSMVIIGQADVSKNYEELMRRLVLAAVAKLNPGKNNRTAWSAAVAYFRDHDQSLMTEQERLILRKG